VERRDLISFNEKALPELDVKIGGLSGGPALLLQKGDYPVLAGIITNRCPMSSADLEMIQFATLDRIPKL
jgi:hypothetical protein